MAATTSRRAQAEPDPTGRRRAPGAPSAARAVLDIATHDLRARLRDRTALVIAFAAPLGLAVILATALGGGGDIDLTIAVADEDGGLIGDGIASGLADDPTLTATTMTDADALRAAVDEGEASAGIVVPAGTLTAVAGGGTAELVVVRRDGSLSGDLAEAIARGTAARLDQAGRVGAVAQAMGAGLPPGAALGVELPSALVVADAPVEGALPNAASYFGPAMAVFFVFFVVGAGPLSLIRQREQGSMARLAAAPIPRWTILAGTGVSVMVLAFLSIGVLWLVMTLGFGASWGNPMGVVVLALVITLAAAGLTMLIATMVRTEEQASGLTSIVVFTLVLVGGSFGPLPGDLASLSLATPNGLALRGFVDLAAGAGLAEVALPALGVVAFALVTLLLAVPRADRLVSP